MVLSQEFTLSDETNGAHVIELSDIYLDVGTTGYTEKLTGLKLSGDVRFVLPTSKLSQYKTQLLTVGPGLALSRKFSVLSGLTLSYGARFTGHFNQYTTGRTSGQELVACTDPAAAEACAFGENTGGRNVFFDIGQGPAISFSPIESVSIDAVFIMSHGWLYPLAAAPPQFQGSTQIYDNGMNTKDLTRFVLSVNWQFSKPVGVSLTALTVGGQLGLDGQYIFPLFNRATTLYLDFSLDIEAVTSRLF